MKIGNAVHGIGATPGCSCEAARMFLIRRKTKPYQSSPDGYTPDLNQSMKTFEFSVIFRHTSRTDKNLKVQFQGNDNRQIGDLAFAWFGQHLRTKVQYEWQIPSSAAILDGINRSAMEPNASGVISNAVDGILMKVRHVVKTSSAARKAAARGLAVARPA